MGSSLGSDLESVIVELFRDGMPMVAEQWIAGKWAELGVEGALLLIALVACLGLLYRGYREDCEEMGVVGGMGALFFGLIGAAVLVEMAKLYFAPKAVVVEHFIHLVTR